jgi:MSHA pilin protein MshC
LGHNRGFTLIEIIAVLVIIVIISAVAISRSMATGAARSRAETDTLISNLRYAQYLAMNDISPTTGGVVTGTQWGINIGANSYQLVKYVGGALVNPTPFNLPGESSATHSFETPVVSTGTPALVLFDEWGSPYSDPATKLAANATITLNPGSQTITITQETGFIP